MDFKGQYYNERFFQILVILFGIVGFIVGYIMQDFRLTFYFLAAGGTLSAVVRTQRTATPAHARRCDEAARGITPHGGTCATAARSAAIINCDTDYCLPHAVCLLLWQGLPAGLAVVESAPARVARAA